MDGNLLLLHLPVELLEFIIDYATPEGFQSLALSCKALHAICKPRMSSFNALHRQYCTFRYGLKDPAFPFRILTAFHLLARIISEPAVANNIIHADFTIDSRRAIVPKEFYDVNLQDDFLSVLTSIISASPYVREAGLDAGALSAEIEDEVQALRYSQLAATFLLTLLPNIESLVLPQYWKPTESSSRLLDVVVRRAISKPQRSPFDTFVATPLAKVRAISNSTSTSPKDSFPLSWAQHFLALPELRSFAGRSIVCADDDDPVKNDFSMGISKNLTHLDLSCSDLTSSSPLKHSTLAKLLAELPVLVSFRYSHSFKSESSSGHRGWDIERERIWDATEILELIVDAFGKISGNGAGDKLEEMRVVAFTGFCRNDTKVRSLRGSGGRKGKRLLENDLPNLKVLELPLEFITVPLRSSATTEDGPETDKTGNEVNEEGNAWLEFVPASVQRLSFIGPQEIKDGQKEEFEQSFRDFAGKRKLLPNLIELRVTNAWRAAAEFKAGLQDLRTCCEDGGIKFQEIY